MPPLLRLEAPQILRELSADPVRALVKRGQHVGRQQFLEKHRLLVQIERVELRIAELVA